MALMERMLSSRHGRVQALSFSSVTRTVLSMQLSWGPVTLYSRHLYALINSVWSLNCGVVLTEEAVNELLFKKELPRLRLEGSVLSPVEGISIWIASDANAFGWGRTMQGAPKYSREYFSEEECVESSTCRELLGVLRCV